jgi:mannitol/fructose-specific phosphotransferase system IIA component (Ntr-type)
LESLKESFISINLYEKICKNNNVNTHEDQSTLVDFLNDLGVVLHFKDFRLLDTHVLEPRWVTGAVYKIINSEKLEECNGILNLSLLSNILDKNNVDDFYYPKSKYKYIIDLMLKFELCYEICDNQVLIPDLLNIQEPEVILDDDVLIYHLVYDFLPRSIIPRFIVKLNKNIHNRLQWRTGVILKDNVSETIAVIKADYIERLITVSIHGKNKRDFLSVILYTLRNINSDFEKLKVIEKVAMPDNKNVFVSYKHLLVLEKNGIQKYMPEGSEKEYDVKQLLGTVQSSNASEKELIALLIKIIDKHDTVESMLQKANDIIQLQPNFFGLGVNLNAIIEKIAKKKKIKGHNK